MARILVIDDEEGIRAFLAEALERDGHEVAVAASGEAGLRQAAERAFHLVITDLRMPGVDGMTVVRRLRAEQPDTEVIVLTAHGSVETAVDAMKLGAYDYLKKPLGSPAELRLLVARAVERRTLLSGRARAALDQDDAAAPLTWADPAMAPVVSAIARVAPTTATVLLVGESGTGKEVAARAIHQRSARAAGPFVAINCAALSDGLLESELFGHEKGAFTGAVERRRGRVELADGGTFFLDEVGELRLELQAKLLRALQEKRIERVGSSRGMDVDVRWIAATNRDLHAMMRAGAFREDLYHRLAVFPIALPPLRARRGDIAPLAELLLARACRELKRGPLRLTEAARDALIAADWPGNVRELGNVLERAAILCDGEVVGVGDLWLDTAPSAISEAPGSLAPGRFASAEPAAASALAAPAADPDGEAGTTTLAEQERRAIERALAAQGGNRRRTAEHLGIGLRTLYDKLKRYGLS
jgi:two-component system, NtrC family, response regulator AtoC